MFEISLPDDVEMTVGSLEEVMVVINNGTNGVYCVTGPGRYSTTYTSEPIEFNKVKHFIKYGGNIFEFGQEIKVHSMLKYLVNLMIAEVG